MTQTIKELLQIYHLQYQQNYNSCTKHLAEVYIKRKLWIKCINLLEYEIKKKNKRSEYQNLIGLCYLKMHLYDSSHYHYTQVLQKDSQNLISLLSIAQIYSINKQYTQAIKTYNKILDIDKHNNTAQEKLKRLKFTNYRDSRI